MWHGTLSDDAVLREMCADGLTYAGYLDNQ
jgi:hypothetical protein